MIHLYSNLEVSLNYPAPTHCFDLQNHPSPCSPLSLFSSLPSYDLQSCSTITLYLHVLLEDYTHTLLGSPLHLELSPSTYKMQPLFLLQVSPFPINI